MKKKDITRREFLRGAGAAAAGIAAFGLFGTGALASGEGSGVSGEASAASGEASGEALRGVLAFTSDQHGETDGLRDWIAARVGEYGDALVHLSYGGDICNKSWEPDVFEGFRAVLDELLPGRYAVTTGNQEHKTGVPAWDTLGPAFVESGVVAETDDYIIYHLGAAQESMAFQPGQIGDLADYLASAPNNIPIFVVSHYPLHLSVPYDGHDIPGGYRQASNNDALIAALNDHPNVVFLWGHNHTFADPRYGTIRPAGVSFTWSYDNPADKAVTGFVYANMGSFCRGDAYGLIAELKRDSSGVVVTMRFMDKAGVMESKQAAVVTFAPDGTVTTDVTREGVIDFDDMLALSGYPDDPRFREDF